MRIFGRCVRALLATPCRPVFKLLRESLSRVAGIRLHEGKTKVWSGTAPEDTEELGEEAWQPEGLKVLGSHRVSAVHHREVARTSGRRTTLLGRHPHRKESSVRMAIVVAKRQHPGQKHTLRTLPPSLSGRHAQDHDDGTWATVKALLQQVPGEVEEQNFAREIATLPLRMGGLGLRSGTRCAAAAYWASWADALAMISQRNPGVANLVVRTMEGELPHDQHSRSGGSRGVCC